VPGSPFINRSSIIISGKISCGDWTIGSKLPSQRLLADRFGVNRSTVVRALKSFAPTAFWRAPRGKARRSPAIPRSVTESTVPPDWGKYLKSGTFQENVPTIQVINKLEFEDGIIRLAQGSCLRAVSL
jgi:GntR family transcriptional regulator of abcA and norABC